MASSSKKHCKEEPGGLGRRAFFISGVLALNGSTPPSF